MGGQIGVDHPTANSRHKVGSQLHTVHWGGAGGSGYMLNFPHKVLVLTYTGILKDTATQSTMWRATFGALRRGGAKPVKASGDPHRDETLDVHTPCRKRPSGDNEALSDICTTPDRKATSAVC